jgi:hypothetical protein
VIANFDQATIGGILGAMVPTALMGIGWGIRLIIKNRKAVARGVIAGLELNEGKTENIPGESTLTAAILEMLRRMEVDRQADRTERSRQWERIEQLAISSRDNTSLAREHTNALQGMISTMQNFALAMDHAHRYQTEQIAGVTANQVHLSEWIRARESLWSHPPFRQSGN